MRRRAFMSTSKKSFSLKPLFASVLLALGVSPVVEADEIFENYNGYNQQTFYAPQLTLSGFYGNDGGSYGEADILYPLIQDPFQLFYTDIRAQKDNASMWQAAVGLGYRFLTPDAQQLYGAYVFYNYENSYLNNTFGQMIGGLEFKTNYIGARLNYYHSVGQTKVYTPSQNDITYNHLSGINYGMMVSNAYEEQEIQGTTAEIGGPVPYVTGLRLFGGYYYFTGYAEQPIIAGPSARIEYRLEESLDFQIPFVERLTLESTWQHDKVNGHLWTVGARLTLPLGFNNSSKGLRKEMTDYVRFNRSPMPAVVYTDATRNQVNGHDGVFAFVNSAEDFNTAIDPTNNSDVIVINSDISVIGNQSLPDNVLITGQNFEYQPGLVTNVTGKNTITSVTAPNETNVFYLGQNNTVRDLLVNQLISNNNFKTVGNLTITNLNSTSPEHGVYINVNDGSNNSNITIDSNKFNINSGIAINLTVQSGAIMNVVSINNNTISIQPGENNTGIFIYNSGIQTVGSVNNNTISVGGATNPAADHQSQGIFINNSSTEEAGHQTIDAVNNNTITVGDSGGNTDQFNGINVYSNGKIQTVNAINNNSITVTANDSTITQNVNGINIFANNATVQNINNLINNTFYFSGNVAGITGINVWAEGNSTININKFYNNALGNITADNAISLTTGAASNIVISITGTNTLTNGNALSVANNSLSVSEDPNYDPANPGKITIYE